jgi:hypothetical protein
MSTVIPWRVSTNNFSLALFGLEPNLLKFVDFLSLLSINDVSLDGFMKLFEHHDKDPHCWMTDSVVTIQFQAKT